MFSFDKSDKVERLFLVGAALGTAVLVAALVYGFLYMEG
jgi:hypothetical protein